jgi:hypothetical protein
MVAASGYAQLASTSPEPVLASIARRLAGDEARHAASFFAYAGRHLARSRTPDDDRRDALKILYLWLNGDGAVRHPVNEFYGRSGQRPDVQATLAALGFPGIPRARITRVVGALIGVPLEEQGDVLARLRELGGGSDPRREAEAR